MSNRTMINAKMNSKDEFYTQVKDIEDELRFYRPHFEDKVLYLNTDHPDYSNFYWHFKMLFDVYKLKKIITTFWDPDGEAFKTVYNGEEEIRTLLEGDGDFRSDECIQILKESDIVVTNPPFSLFREFLLTLVKHDKQFLIMGNNMQVLTKEIFPLFRENKIWFGNTTNTAMKFEVPEEYNDQGKAEVDSEGRHYLSVPAISWYTNLDYPKRHDEMLLWASYKGSEDFYPYYDNYDAINVKGVKYIPYDFEGVMGVPITFMEQYNPNQFEIVGISSASDDETIGMKTTDGGNHGPKIDGKKVYTRIYIKNKKPVQEIEL